MSAARMESLGSDSNSTNSGMVFRAIDCTRSGEGCMGSAPAGDARSSVAARQIPPGVLIENSPTLAASSFDHLVRTSDQRRRNGKTERLGGFEVDDYLKICGGLDRKVGGLLALENAIDVTGRASKLTKLIVSVTKQAARLGKRTAWI